EGRKILLRAEKGVQIRFPWNTLDLPIVLELPEGPWLGTGQFRRPVGGVGSSGKVRQPDRVALLYRLGKVAIILGISVEHDRFARPFGAHFLKLQNLRAD